jgi:hypothetical protein
MCLLCPTSGGCIEFVGENAHGNRDGDAFGTEECDFSLILPTETGARKPGVRQPGDGDVVEDVIAHKALRLSRKDARDQLVAALAVIQGISCWDEGEALAAIGKSLGVSHVTEGHWLIGQRTPSRTALVLAKHLMRAPRDLAPGQRTGLDVALSIQLISD